VPGQYIVTVGKAADPGAVAKKAGVRPMFSYGKVLRGFAVTLSPSQLTAMRRISGVTAVEENGRVSGYGGGPDLAASHRGGPPRGTHGRGVVPEVSPAGRDATQAWGLDRIDQQRLPLDHRFFSSGDGRGATAYIMDTGIDYGHDEFGGRAVPGLDTVGDGRDGADCNGHGTHVAGTVAGRTDGVAPAARMVSVRVLDCTGSGSWAQVLAGMDWVAAHAVQPAVLNASLGGPYSQAVNEATDALAGAGVLPVVAAGNSAQDACDVSPAGAAHAFTVGATDQDDRQTSFSDFGSCVSLFAPGKDIVSALIGGGSVAQDGTSAASPHAAGVALLYKAGHPSASADQVAAWLLSTSTKDVLTVNHASPNRLLYTGGL
jgi:subtilisin family serine protease